MYQDLLSQEGIEANYMSVIVPRRQVTGFTLFFGSVYSKSFDYGQVVRVDQNGVALVEAFSTSLSAGQFYYDVTNSVLYVRMSDSSNPSTKFVVSYYEIYVATSDAHWYRDPLDDTTRVVYFDDLIQNPVAFKSTISDSLFGYLPLQTTNVVLIDAEHVFEKHIYDSSFNQASIKIYHVLDKIQDIDIDNIKLVYDGFCSDIIASSDRITIKTFDRIDQLSQEWRNSDESFYNTTDFPDCEPTQVGRAIRYVYGMVDGFAPVNVDYVSENPTTSDNRDWACVGEQTLSDLSRTVAAAPASTATRTYLNNASGFQVGDSVWLDRAVGTDEYVLVTAVNYASDYIEHDTLTGGAMASGDLAKRSFVGNLFIVQNQITYRPMFGRDYVSNYAMNGGVSGFTFSVNLETDLSMPSTLSVNDRVFGRIYGRMNDVTIGGGAFGGNDAETNNLTHPVVILYDILKSQVPLDEDLINLTSFQGLETGNTEAVGFAIPDKKGGSFPNLKTIVNEILQTTLIRLYIDDDLKWKVTRLAPLGTAVKSTDDEEILRDSFQYTFSYADTLSTVVVQYAEAENNPSEPSSSGGRLLSISQDSDVAVYLHRIKKQKTFGSLHFRSADASVLASRLRYYLGDRKGEIRMNHKNRFFDTLINDSIEVSRTKLPGYSFDGETAFSRKFSVTDITKGLRVVELTLEDQKGIEDHSGSW